MRMSGNLGNLGFTSEMGKRATNGDSGRASKYASGGSSSASTAPMIVPAGSAQPAVQSSPAAAPVTPVATGVVALPSPVPHLTAEHLRRAPGVQQGPSVLRVSPTASASSSSGGSGGGGGGGSLSMGAETAEAKPGLPLGLLGLLAYLFLN